MDSSSSRLDLPLKEFSILSHINNINYCIKLLLKNKEKIKDPVIGYINQRSQAVREVSYRIISREEAGQLKSGNPRFDYKTLNDFFNRKDGIKRGKYLVDEKGIINFNPNYK